jgi:hypothetical protein
VKVDTKHTAQTILYVGLAVVALLLSACNDRGNDHPATALQRAATAHVADPASCPSGDSRDIQRIVDAAGSAEVISLPEGCYRTSYPHPLAIGGVFDDTPWTPDGQ